MVCGRIIRVASKRSQLLAITTLALSLSSKMLLCLLENLHWVYYHSFLGLDLLLEVNSLK